MAVVGATSSDLSSEVSVLLSAVLSWFSVLFSSTEGAVSASLLSSTEGAVLSSVTSLEASVLLSSTDGVVSSVVSADATTELSVVSLAVELLVPSGVTSYVLLSVALTSVAGVVIESFVPSCSFV